MFDSRGSSIWLIVLVSCLVPHYILDRTGGNVKDLLLVQHSHIEDFLKYVASPGDRLGRFLHP